MFAVPDNTIALAERPALRHPVRVALDFAADRDNWRHLLRYDPVERFSTLVSSENGQEIWLMGWLPGQGIDLHDHELATGAFTVVSGVLSETVIRRFLTGETDTDAHPVRAGQSRVFGPGYVHQVRNDSTDPAISVHVYRSGGRAVRPYRLDPTAGVVRVGE